MRKNRIRNMRLAACAVYLAITALNASAEPHRLGKPRQLEAAAVCDVYLAQFLSRQVDRFISSRQFMPFVDDDKELDVEVNASSLRLLQKAIEFRRGSNEAATAEVLLALTESCADRADADGRWSRDPLADASLLTAVLSAASFLRRYAREGHHADEVSDLDARCQGVDDWIDTTAKTSMARYGEAGRLAVAGFAPEPGRDELWRSLVLLDLVYAWREYMAARGRPVTVPDLDELVVVIERYLSERVMMGRLVDVGLTRKPSFILLYPVVEHLLGQPLLLKRQFEGGLTYAALNEAASTWLESTPAFTVQEIMDPRLARGADETFWLVQKQVLRLRASPAAPITELTAMQERLERVRMVCSQVVTANGHFLRPDKLEAGINAWVRGPNHDCSWLVALELLISHNFHGMTCR